MTHFNIIKYSFVSLLIIHHGFALRCFDCFINGPLPFEFLKPSGPRWEMCSGSSTDIKSCEGVCVEIMLYGNDISKYQVLRSCVAGKNVCHELDVAPEINVGECKVCRTDECNKTLL